MVRAMQVPEHADGGWWYAVPAVSGVEGLEPDLPEGVSNWSGWFWEVGGTVWCVVRSADPIPASMTQVGPSRVLAVAQQQAKPHSRVWGR